MVKTPRGKKGGRKDEQKAPEAVENPPAGKGVRDLLLVFTAWRCAWRGVGVNIEERALFWGVTFGGLGRRSWVCDVRGLCF